MTLGVKIREAGLGADVAKDDVRVDVRVEIANALFVARNGVLKRGLRLRVGRVPAAPVVSGAALDAVAVDVHVGQVAVAALDVDDSVPVEVIATVGICWITGVRARFKKQKQSKSLKGTSLLCPLGGLSGNSYTYSWFLHLCYKSLMREGYCTCPQM